MGISGSIHLSWGEERFLAFPLLYPGMMGANGLGMDLMEGNVVWEGNQEEVTAGCCCGPKVSNANWEAKPCQVYLGHFQRFWLFECPVSMSLDAWCWTNDGHGGVRLCDCLCLHWSLLTVLNMGPSFCSLQEHSLFPRQVSKLFLTHRYSQPPLLLPFK